MRFFWANLGGNLVALVSIGAAVYLIVNDKGHWGWFVFIAIVTVGSYTDRKDKDDDDD